MKKKLTSTRKDNILSILSTLSLILAIIILFTLIFLVLYKANVIDIPIYLKNIFNADKKNIIEVIPGDDGKIYDALKNGKPFENSVIHHNIDEKDIKELLMQSSNINQYYISNEVMIKNQEDKIIRQNKIWRIDNKYRIQISENNEIIKTIVCDGYYVYIRNNLDNSLRIYPLSDEFSIENQTGLPSKDNFINRDDFSNLNIALIRSPDSNMYYVTFEYDDINQREEYYISLEYGLVLAAEGYYNDTLIYTISTKSINTDLSKFDVSTLFIP